MSQREFERYLLGLGRLLELDEGEREAVVDELRDHLEARLAELLDKGFEREEAIGIALDECGDAASLARSLMKVQRTHLSRRWIMRTSAVMMAAAAVIALAVTLVLPGNSTALQDVENSRPVQAESPSLPEAERQATPVAAAEQADEQRAATAPDEGQESASADETRSPAGKTWEEMSEEERIALFIC